jgi:hypothetical protein
MRARTVFVFAVGGALLGCGALIGVRDDVFFDESAEGGASSSGASSSGAASSSGNPGDGGADAPITCNADLQTSKEHCGRCGHGCGGGECTAGKCQPVQLSSVALAPFNFIAEYGDHVYVSTLITLTTQAGGLWRIPKSGGAAEPYVTLRYAGNMRVLGDKLFFVVEDSPGDGGPDQTGGLYFCLLSGPSPCQPSRITSANEPAGIAVDGTRVIFTDDDVGQRIFDTANSQFSVLVPNGGRHLFVDGTTGFYNFTYQPSGSTQYAYTYEVLPDASVELRHEYVTTEANAGTLAGNKDYVFITAYDWVGALTGGVVHRHPRTGGGLPCDYGGTTNKRPYGVTIDTQRIFWTNQGIGSTEPFTGGSVNTCELAGCCAQSEVLWTGDGQPSAITNDANFLYWVTEKSSGVWKVAKP